MIEGKQLAAAFGVIRTLADTIQELGQVPSGILYSQVMSFLSLAEYERAIDILV